MSASAAANDPVQLVFYGETLPGLALEDVQRKLTHALGLTPEQAKIVFSGRRVILKKALPQEQVARYVEQLAQIGVVAKTEPMPAAATAVTQANAPVRPAMEIPTPPPPPPPPEPVVRAPAAPAPQVRADHSAAPDAVTEIVLRPPKTAPASTLGAVPAGSTPQANPDHSAAHDAVTEIVLRPPKAAPASTLGAVPAQAAPRVNADHSAAPDAVTEIVLRPPKTAPASTLGAVPVSSASHAASEPPIPPAPITEFVPEPAPQAKPELSLIDMGPTPAELAAAEAAAQATANATPVPPGVEEITCPRCGHKQPKRTLCLNCSTDMPRFLAAQKAQTKEDNAVAKDPALAGKPGSARKSVAEAESVYAIEGEGLIGTSFQGRIGRLGYIAGGCLAFAVLGLGGMLAIKLHPVLIAPFLLVFLFLNLRVSVLRLHDLGLSGWFVLASLIPLVGNVMALAFLFWPGKREDNDYGKPTEQPGVMIVLASVVAALVMTGGFSSMVEKYVAKKTGARIEQSQGSRLQKLANYDPASNTIVMYSLTTCGYCTAKRKEFNELGIHFTEVFIDQDQSAQDRLNDKLQKAGVGGGSIGTPIVEVNGVLLPNNPDLEEIAGYLKGKST